MARIAVLTALVLAAQGPPTHASAVGGKDAPVPGWRAVVAAFDLPLRYTFISSGFSLGRWHPITHRRRPHLGVDFAAPRGTPVRAVAGGRITEATRGGPLGRYVRIAHAGDVESLYAHLGRIAPGAQAGRTVRRGDVIGWVGTSGWATGPHLHFSVSRDGWYFDPLHLAAPPIPSGDALRVARATARARDRREHETPRVAGGRPPPATKPAHTDVPSPGGPTACGRWSIVPLPPSDLLPP